MPRNRKAYEDSRYVIDFHTLGVGKSYDYAFPIDDRFFQRWPESEVRHGEGEAKVTLVRHASTMEPDVQIDAQVEITCDRCLEEFRLPVRFEGNPLVKISEAVPEGETYGTEGNNDGEVLWISPSDEELDLAQYIYESIILSLPFQRVHPRLEACNPDMLERFRIVTQEEFDELASASGDSPEEDTENPFAALAALKEEDGQE